MLKECAKTSYGGQIPKQLMKTTGYQIVLFNLLIGAMHYEA